VLYTQSTRWGRKIIYGRVFTTPIDNTLAPNFESVASCPCLFQEYVPKTFELRVTVVLDDVFAAEIHSQQRMETRHDWRRKVDGGLT
jgi:glutathione synthase/RimK-type ligase-like ATP-grasp enzyme